MDPNKDPVEFTRDSLSHGSGPVWMVWAPQHPKTRGVHPNPEHAVITATTGNGPASEANARLYASAPDLLAALAGIIEIGKRDLTNPKYDAYFEEARAALKKARGGQ
jgi:hypothetical protein